MDVSEDDDVEGRWGAFIPYQSHVFGGTILPPMARGQSIQLG